MSGMGDRRPLTTIETAPRRLRPAPVRTTDVVVRCDRRLGVRSLCVAVAVLLIAGCGSADESTEPVVREGNAALIRSQYAAVGGVEVSPWTLDSGAGASAGGSSANGATSTTVAHSTTTESSTTAALASDAVAPAPTAADAASGAVAGTGTVEDTAAAGSSPDTKVPDASAAAVERFAGEALDAINAARAQPRRCGDQPFPAVGPLRWNARAAYAALLEVEWMQSANTFGHEWPNGEHVWHRLEMAGYQWRRADENIAAGFRTLAAVMQGWIDSPPHCVALMRPDITEVGVAVVPGTSSNTYLSYWAMALATPASR